MPMKTAEERKEYQRKYYQTHMEAAKAYQKEYSKAHKKTSTKRGKQKDTALQTVGKLGLNLHDLTMASADEFEKQLKDILSGKVFFTK